MTELARLGAKLRDAGLVPRMLATWTGSDRLSALAARLPHVVGRPRTRASALLALFVAGEDVPVEQVTELDALLHHDLVEVRDGHVHARVTILPLGEGLLVCDRFDTADSLDIVCWPDDSSYHLARSLPPGRSQRWLDLGCGSAFAALLRPELAASITCADVNPRALAYARLGLALSGIGHATVVAADLGDGVPDELRDACALVSCNAPIPEEVDPPHLARWKRTDASFVARMFAHARSFVAAGGTVVAHVALDAVQPALDALGGDRVVVAYTPEHVREFGVVWWRPDGEDRLVRVRRALSALRPHVSDLDREGALAG